MENNISLYRTPEGEQAVMAMYDTVLKNWSAPYQTQMISTRQGDTFVITSGETAAPALILLHGAGGNSSMWAPDIADYSRHFRVYAVDLPGEAGKSTSNRPAWEGSAFVEWLEDVLNALNVDRATLVGISQGAWTALKFAVVMPERVEKLVLIAPGGIVPDRLSFILRAVVLLSTGEWGARRMVDSLFADQPVLEVVKVNVARMMRQFKGLIGRLPIFSDDELRRLTMPVLLLGGTKDIMRDLSKIEARLRAFVPDLTVKSIVGGGHALINTRSEVLDFLTTSELLHDQK
ncbi:MAG TPA: alpha/beta hydrolase [Phototrophicaceae bacterium]|jgi:pimeloyl-ACP methyl ester carboxylesterase|nr:alpha/beta hydrolase [Phototrophicaceae bacterium]